MKIIKCLSELIEGELIDADKYIELAMRWKQEEPDTADLFYELSTEEMGHVDKLHEEVVELIEKAEFIADPLDAYENKIFCKGAPLKTGVIWNKEYIEEDK